MKKLSFLGVATTAFVLLGATVAFSQGESGQFGRMDRDQNGRVTWDELHQYHPSMSKDSFQAADVNRDGHLTHDEWYHFEDKPRMGRHGKYKHKYRHGKGMGKGLQKGRYQPQETRFDSLDTDGNRLLSYEELKKQVHDASKEQFSQADADKDGSLDHNEWARSRESFGYGVGNRMGRGKN